jgi:YjjG family noncanonical pyrimidine nucleotidase
MAKPQHPKLDQYDWVLFDADDTLFHFDSFSGLKNLFSTYGVEFTQSEYQEYQTINLPLWVEYQNGKISADTLKERRFEAWGERLNVAPKVLNRRFLLAMADLCTPMDGVKELLSHLHGQARMGIITNGFVDLQEIRLERTGIRSFFDLLVISEQVGFAKPDPEIFSYALTQMGKPDPSRVLMIGDNPHSDILGGTRAGLDTLWVNPKKIPRPEGIQPTFEFETLKNLTQDVN